MTKIYFNNYSTEHLGPIYKDNYIDADGLIVEVDIDLTEVNYMYVNFKVGQLSYTNDVSIVDIENNIVSVPVPTEVLKEGTHQLELVATMNNGSVIPSRTYKYSVDESLENPNAVEAESYYPILITLIEEVTDKINEVNDVVVEINTALSNKISEVDTKVNNKINEVNEVIEQVELSEQARKEEHTELVNELSSYSSDINNVKDRVEVLEAKVTDIVDLKNKVNNHEERVSANEKTIRHQGVLIDALFDLTETISITEEGNAISLPQSKEGTIIIDELQGNTLVNYCTNGSEELTLNNEINAQGTNVTLTDTIDNGKVDVVCEGNTLVNLVPKCEDLIWDGDTGFNFNVWKSTSTLLYPTKHSTTYTVVVNIKQNNLALNGELKKNTNFGHLRSVGGFNNADITIPDNYVGIYKKVITSTDTGGHRNLNELAWSVSGKNPEGDILINQGKLIIGDIMLLEGDWTNKEISYFEGMKSAFELEDNKVEVMSVTAKNLCDLKTVNQDWELGTMKVVISSNDLNHHSCEPFDISHLRGKTIYAGMFREGILRDSQIQFAVVFDENGNRLGNRFYITSNGYLVPNNAKYMRLMNYCGGNSLSWIDKDKYVIRLEPFTSGEELVRYKSNKNEIQLSEPLRGLPNGVCDKFVKQGGKWYVERNCGEVLLNGSEDWKLANTYTSTYKFVTWASTLQRASSQGNNNKDQLSDRLIITNPYMETKNSVWVYGTQVRLFLDGSQTTTEEFKQWLQQNPTKVVYQLATPTYEEITDLQLITYLDTTHISTNSTIPCNMQVKNSGYNTIIKPSTKYTVAFDSNKAGEVNIGLGGAKTSTTNNVATITTPRELTDDTLRLYGKGIKASNVRLLEGDKTNYIPQYFEGMKSCFEDKLQGDGTYKMEILSNNKNLISHDYMLDKENWTHALNYNSIGSGYSDGDKLVLVKNELESIPNQLYYMLNLTNLLKPNTTYTLSFKNIRAIRYDDVEFDATNVWANDVLSNSDAFGDKVLSRYVFDRATGICTITFTTPDTFDRIIWRVNFMKNWTENPFKEIRMDYIQLEEGQLTSYEPHKSNSIQLQLNEPLRAVDDVKDRFVLKDGKLMIERNFIEYTLDKNVNVGIHNPNNNSTIRFSYPIEKPNNDNKIISDTLLRVGASSSVKGIYMNKNGLFIHIPINELTSIDNPGFKEWLQNNPVKIIYQIPEPTYEEVPYETQKLILECFENGTLFIDTLIPPTVGVTYSAHKPIATALNEIRTVQDEQDAMILENSVNIAMMNLTM